MGMVVVGWGWGWSGERGIWWRKGWVMVDERGGRAVMHGPNGNTTDAHEWTEFGPGRGDRAATQGASE